MTDTGQPTSGFGIKAIRLERVSFEAPEDTFSLGRSRGTGFLDTKVAIGKAQPQEGGFSVTLEVRVSGLVEDQECWKAEVMYRGHYALEADSILDLERASKIHAPAYMYAYAREAIADMVRRSGLGVVDFPPIPPWTFLRALNAEKKLEQADGNQDDEG